MSGDDDGGEGRITSESRTFAETAFNNLEFGALAATDRLSRWPFPRATHSESDWRLLNYCQFVDNSILTASVFLRPLRMHAGICI